MLIASACFTFPSCQDEDIAQGEQFEVSTDIKYPFSMQLPDTNTYPLELSKVLVGRKYDSVYCLNEEFEYESSTKYKTVKLRNPAGTIIQEWLLEDLKCNAMSYLTHPDDPTGEQYGYYYQWEGCLKGISQSEWNFMFHDANNNPETGFHIPTSADMDNLGTILGGTENAPRYLQLSYDGFLYDASRYWTGLAAFWKEPYNPIWTEYNGHDPNQEEGCGILFEWYVPGTNEYSDGVWVAYTNIPDLNVNVRMVRTLTLDQW